jgi:sigma-B regulation protein RsbU (phosphoserine phosphatase)
MRAAVSDAAAASGCGEACIRDIVIAVDEACQNVIRHAYKGEPGNDVVVDMRYMPEYLVFYVIDFGPPANVDEIKPRPLDELRPGGLGTHFIKECMDETEFRALPDGAGNMLEMVKRIY